MTYDSQAPYSSNIFTDIVRIQFFLSKGVSDSEVFRKMVTLKYVPAATYALVATTVRTFTSSLYSMLILHPITSSTSSPSVSGPRARAPTMSSLLLFDLAICFI